jgi:hypothetical protein
LESVRQTTLPGGGSLANNGMRIRMSTDAIAEKPGDGAAATRGLWALVDDERVSVWSDRVSDYFNPILVKEVRQSLRSWTFLGTFAMLVLASWLVSVFGVSLAGPGAAYGQTGAALFYAYFLVLGFACFLIVPFSAYRSLLQERDLATFEVLSITTLRPGQIVMGKLLSSCAQMFVFLSALTPFVAFTYLLRGIDILTIIGALVLATFAGVGLSMICLTLSALFYGRGWGALQTLFVFGQLFGSFFALTSMIFAASAAGAMFVGSPGYWGMILLWLTYYVGYFYLLYAISVAQLTFEADNRSSRMRLALSGLALVSITWLTGAHWVGTFGSTWLPRSAVEEVSLAIGWVGLFHWAGFGLFFVTEPDRLSDRVRRSIPRIGLLRLLGAQYFPGGALGLVFSIVHLAVTLALVVTIHVFVSGTIDNNVIALGVANLYVMIYLGAACWLARVGSKNAPGFNSGHARVTIVILAAIAAIVPALIESVYDRKLWDTSLHLTNPSIVIYQASQNPNDVSLVLLILLVCAGASVLFNLAAVFAAFLEIVKGPPRQDVARSPAEGTIVEVTENQAIVPA